MCEVIAITNQKGGVGKTTTAVSVAAGLKRIGKKVLLIDADPQCNSTDTYRAKINNVATLFDLLCGEEKATDCIQTTDNGDIIACDYNLKFVEQKIESGISRNYILKEKCESLKSLYDFIIIDTPPCLGVLLLNVLIFSDSVIIPVICDRYSLQGLSELNKTINEVKKYANENLMIKGLLIVKYKKQEKLCKEFIEKIPEVENTLNTKTFNTYIREAAACRNSQANRECIYQNYKNSNATFDYKNLCYEILGV